MDELFSLVANQMRDKATSKRACELVTRLYSKHDAFKASCDELTEALDFISRFFPTDEGTCGPCARKALAKHEARMKELEKKL